MKPLIILVLCVFLHTFQLCGQQIEIDSIKTFGNDALKILYGANSGINILSTAYDGIKINETGAHGINIFKPSGNGVLVNSPGNDGFSVYLAESNGVFISQPVKDGIYIRDPGDDAIHINSATDAGLYVEHTDGPAISISDCGNDAIYVYRADQWSMNIQGSKAANPADPIDHIAQIYNRRSTGGPDVLALKVGAASPGATSNFITFFDGGNNPLGRIEGNGSGGVAFESGGADFAEYLPVRSIGEKFYPGEIVGLHAGQISHQTKNADEVMVITDRAILVGNQLNMEDKEYPGYVKVSFMGQVPVWVNGPVSEGDWIVASGKSDGSGMAIPSEDLSLQHKIVGRAWEGSSDRLLKRVNTRIGGDHSAAIKKTVIRQQQQIQNLTQEIHELKKLLLHKDDPLN